MIFLLTGFTMVSAIKTETKDFYTTSVKPAMPKGEGSIIVYVTTSFGYEDRDVVEGTEVELKDKQGNLIDRKEGEWEKPGWCLKFDHILYNGIYQRFYLTAYPAEKGYRGTTNKRVVLSERFPDKETVVYIWKGIRKTAHIRILDLLSAFPLLHRLLKF